MPDLTENSFINYSLALQEISEELIDEILILQRQYAAQVIANPSVAIRLQRQIIEKYNTLVAAFISQASNEMKNALPKAYLRGIQQMNAQAKALGVGVPSHDIMLGQMLAPDTRSIPGAGRQARLLLEKFPRHLTMYEVFEAAAARDIEDMRFPIVRSSADVLRAVAIEAGEAQYLEANKTIRRKITQDMLDRFADRGITGKIDTGGRRWMLDSYTEMVARTQTGNAARQAHINRQQQYGLDLVRISSHSPTSDLCRPWQGRVFSLSGKSKQYPPLADAIGGGLYHPNCKHSQHAYVPGVSETLENPGEFASDKRADAKAYKIDQKQRYNERQIRHWKRREAVALDKQTRQQAREKIELYQARNRRLVDEHGYLRRKYHRESITGIGRKVG